MDRYIYGHPSHETFKSIISFVPHCKYLLSVPTGASGPCKCDLCVKFQSRVAPTTASATTASATTASATKARATKAKVIKGRVTKSKAAKKTKAATAKAVSEDNNSKSPLH